MSKRLIRIIAAFVLLIAVQAAGMPLMAEAHIGTIGYSDIRAAGKTINYTLYLEAREVEQWVTIRTRKVIVLDPAASAPAGPSGQSRICSGSSANRLRSPATVKRAGLC